MLQSKAYYLPKPSYWPMLGCIALFCLALGAANWVHGKPAGPWLLMIGAGILLCMMLGWFGTVIHESLRQEYNEQVDKSFRLGMLWFIFTEICFFGVFFSALFYARLVSVPTLGGTTGSGLTQLLLWPNFEAHWPVFSPPAPALFPGMHSIMDPFGIPALNTLVLLSSGVTITWAHWAVVRNKQRALVMGLACTILLGILFLYLQTQEYYEAYKMKGLTLHSGIYGTTFFLLTGFHGLHVTLGTIMLIVILLRSLRHHFNSQHHFAFEAVSWYWHFVDVVWLGLFILVYWW
jgi:cytochrome c oxidase subunit III